MEKMKIVNFPARRFDYLRGDWPNMYLSLWEAFHKLGYEIRVSGWFQSDNDDSKSEPLWKKRRLNNRSLPDYVKVGIVDDPNHLYVFNHTHVYEIEKHNWNRGKINFFVKPSGPGGKHFTIDTLGYASHSSVTYQKPNFENVKYEDFYNTEVKEWINNKINKWDGDENEPDFIEPTVNIPEDHILFIGQMPGDEVCSHFSFGDHWHKFNTLINSLVTNKPVVIKLHPYMGVEGSQEWAISKGMYNTIAEWKDRGYTVLLDFTNIHNILPKTNVAIVENSTAGLECLMHDVPVISYGYPEYHWVTKDLRHAINISKYANDISWYNEYAAKSWFTWYAKEYVCHDTKSSINRLKQII